MEFLNERNFIGYGKTKPKLFWPDKNKLAISFVVNIEEGAELSISSGDKEWKEGRKKGKEGKERRNGGTGEGRNK